MQRLTPDDAESVLRGAILDHSPVEAALATLAATDGGVARLLVMATGPQQQVAWLGIEGLARARTRSGLRWAIEAVFADAARSRRAAARRAALWGMTEQPATPLIREALRGALGDRDPVARLLAAHALGRCARVELRALQWAAVLPHLEHPDPAVRARCYDALGAARLQQAIPALRDACAIESPPLRPRALIALARVAPIHAVSVATADPTPALIQALVDAPIARPPALSDAETPPAEPRAPSVLDPWRAPVRPQTHRRLRGPLHTHPLDRGREVGFLLSPAVDDACVRGALAWLPHGPAEAPDASPRARLIARAVRPREAPVCAADHAPPVRVSINGLIEWGVSRLESGALDAVARSPR